MSHCPICLEYSTKRGGQMVTLSTCGHVFHESCLKTWLSVAPSCPTCRVEVVRNFCPYIKIYLQTDKDDNLEGLSSAADEASSVAAARTERNVMMERLAEMRDLIAKMQEDAVRHSKEVRLFNADVRAAQKKIEKLNTNLTKKQTKLEKDMILKNKIRADNKLLREKLLETKQHFAQAKLDFQTEKNEWRVHMEKKSKRLSITMKSHHTQVMKLFNVEPSSLRKKEED